jgi:hypothetical protein
MVFPPTRIFAYVCKSHFMTITLRNLTSFINTLSGNSATLYAKAAIWDGFARGYKEMSSIFSDQ